VKKIIADLYIADSDSNDNTTSLYSYTQFVIFDERNSTVAPDPGTIAFTSINGYTQDCLLIFTFSMQIVPSVMYITLFISPINRISTQNNVKYPLFFTIMKYNVVSFDETPNFRIPPLILNDCEDKFKIDL
jgi:hypothetical protein